TLLSRVLATLFPTDSPAVGALLATAYISIFPNLVLFVVPATISRKTLNTLVSFAAGGLIGDVVLHLIPHALMDAANAHARFHQGATVIGIAIFAGILVFFAVDKYMRIQGIGRKDSHGHSHSHSHSHQHHHHHGESVEQKKSAEKTDGDSKDGLRKRNVSKESTDASSVATAAASPAPKAVNYSIYLNMVADASHNFTDGLAIAASFYTSRSIGISTFIAVAFHEIPHEFGDFAILLRGGFPRWKAIATQGLTAIGAFMGTFVGILLEEIARGNSKDSVLGTFLIAWSQLVIPFTAGGFLYIATCGVIPDLLGDTSDD
ncbi:Zinc/iron permease, partial [Ramicandelaber brevisporus]